MNKNKVSKNLGGGGVTDFFLGGGGSLPPKKTGLQETLIEITTLKSMESFYKNCEY